MTTINSSKNIVGEVNFNKDGTITVSDNSEEFYFLSYVNREWHISEDGFLNFVGFLESGEINQILRAKIDSISISSFQYHTIYSDAVRVFSLYSK